MSEVFGVQPNRPDHEDYWRLVSAVLRTDGAAQAGEKVLQTRLGIDPRSVHYMAGSRARRLVQLAGRHNWFPVRAMSNAWLDGYLAGFQIGAADLAGIGKRSDPPPEEAP